MARPTTGLDIGTSAVRVAQVRGKEPPTLVRFAQLTLPPGAVVDGEVHDGDAVVEVLRTLWKRSAIRGRQVGIAVANQKVVVRQVDLPRMTESELRGALQYQVQDYIPIAVEEALLDFLVLDEFVADDGAPMMRVLTVAAHKVMVDAFVDVVFRAGLEPVLVDLAPFAAARALVDPIPSLTGEREAEAIVDVGSGVTDVVVHESGSPRFVRIMLVGGGSITKALVDEAKLGPEEAEQRKSSVGLHPEGEQVTAGPESVIEQHARAFIDDVRASLEYYQQQPEVAPLGRVVLTGGGSRLPRLAERLSTAVRLPVEFGDPFGRVALGELGLTPQQVEQAASVAAVAVGLTLED